VTLVFGEDAISGQGPCNAYRGSAEIDDDDDTVTITDLAQTTRACDPDTERAEREYFDALQHVRDVDLDDAYNAQRLVLDNDSGDRLAFDAIEAAQLLIGTWQVVNVARDDAIESVVDGTDPVLVFAADGEVTLGTGCNPARGSYEVEGDRLSVGALRQTLKSCDEPAGVMDQEVALVRALESGERIEVVPDRLTIIDGDDRITMIAVQEASGQ
jgi:heat shock protein HslJ